MLKSLSRSQFLEWIFNYEEKPEWQYQGTLPCLVEFHDDACAPCQAIDPVVKKLAEEYEGKVMFYRVDMQQEEQLARELGVQNLPTLVLCPLDDRPVVLQGAASKEKLQLAIDRELLPVSEENSKEG